MVYFIQFSRCVKLYLKQNSRMTCYFVFKTIIQSRRGVEKCAFSDGLRGWSHEKESHSALCMSGSTKCSILSRHHSIRKGITDSSRYLQSRENSQ